MDAFFRHFLVACQSLMGFLSGGFPLAQLIVSGTAVDKGNSLFLLAVRQRVDDGQCFLGIGQGFGRVFLVEIDQGDIVQCRCVVITLASFQAQIDMTGFFVKC